MEFEGSLPRLHMPATYPLSLLAITYASVFFFIQQTLVLRD